MDNTCKPDDAVRFWEDRYRSADQVWSGRVNPRLVEVAEGLAAGRALDLGCGEGADALWLAENGWEVVAVDVSATALRRAAEAAAQRNLADRIVFECHDLNETFPAGTFDLISAQYLHSPARLERDGVLRRAAGHVRVGGLLLIVDHGAAPPGAPLHDHAFLGIDEVIALLRLEPGGWTRVRADSVDREVVVDGVSVTVPDNVIALRRDR